MTAAVAAATTANTRNPKSTKSRILFILSIIRIAVDLPVKGKPTANRYNRRFNAQPYLSINLAVFSRILTI